MYILDCISIASSHINLELVRHKKVNCGVMAKPAGTLHDPEIAYIRNTGGNIILYPCNMGYIRNTGGNMYTVSM